MTRLRSALAISVFWFLPLSAQTPPRTPSVERGACPFECCRLGDWTARDSLPVYAQARGVGTPAFVLLPHEHFHADSADFYTMSLGVIVVRQPMVLADYFAEENPPPLVTHADTLLYGALRRPVQPGDTIYLVGHEPEIGEDVWFRGYQVAVGRFWVQTRRRPDPPAVLTRPIVHEWWVRITQGKRRGWIQAWERPIDGADACG